MIATALLLPVAAAAVDMRPHVVVGEFGNEFLCQASRVRSAALRIEQSSRIVEQGSLVAQEQSATVVQTVAMDGASTGAAGAGQETRAGRATPPPPPPLVMTAGKPENPLFPSFCGTRRILRLTHRCIDAGSSSESGVCLRPSSLSFLIIHLVTGHLNCL